MHSTWTDEMTEFLLAASGHMTDREIHEHLVRITGLPVTLQTVRKRRQRLGIEKASGRGVCKVIKKKKGGLDS